MASPDVDSPWLCAASESFGGCFNIQIEEVKSTNNVIMTEAPTSSVYDTCNIHNPPPYHNTTSKTTSHCKRISASCSVPKETRDTWDRLFKEAYGLDVYSITDRNSYIPSHCNVFGIASPVLGTILQQSRVKNGIRYISIFGVPCEAVHVFIRFLHSSWHFKEKMQQQTKKEAAKWELLVSKVIAAKNALGPFTAQRIDLF